GHVAVVAQPVGGRGVAAGPEAAAPVELLDAARALGFQAVDAGADGFDVEAQIPGRNGAQIVLGKQRQALVDESNAFRKYVACGRLKHLVDCSNWRPALKGVNSPKFGVTTSTAHDSHPYHYMHVRRI